MAMQKIITQLIELETEALQFAQRCSSVRKQLEKVAGSSPAPRKGKYFSLADELRMASAREVRLANNKRR
jgi:hypothetical protein